MDIRTPQPSAAAKILRSYFATQGISVRHTTALEAVARMKGYPNTHAMTSDMPDDAELSAFLENAQKEPGNNGEKKELTLIGCAEGIRAALARIPGFVADNFPRVEFAKVVSLHPSELPREERNYSGFTLTVFLEDDTTTGRTAPYACYSKRVGMPGDGWTDLPVPKDSETVMELSVKVVLRAIKAEGITLTNVYDESPTRDA